MRIEIQRATKRFGALEALKDVSLVIPSGRRLALVGPNGSGKSTLIRALLGLVDCDGTVLLDGLSPFDDRVKVTRRLAYVPQVAPALGATVREVVQLVTLTRLLKIEDVARTAASLELDLKAIEARPFRNLSGGMKQKLLLALAFAAQPRLLVMDEPTASLDARSRARFLELCSGLGRDVTVVVCSHRLEELHALADHVIAMEEGKVAFDGPVADYLPPDGELRSTGPVVARSLALPEALEATAGFRGDRCG
jgi:ABC-2 type transport system ATP-binding protein